MGTRNKLKSLPLHLMLLPGVILTLVFSYIPILGIVIAFQKFVPSKGIFHSKWIGLDNFRYMLDMPNFTSVLWNTIFIAVLKIIAGLVIPIIFALLLNEVSGALFKRTIQTTIYFPYFCRGSFWVEYSLIFCPPPAESSTSFWGCSG